MGANSTPQRARLQPVLVQKIVNETLSLVFRHLVPFQAALSANTSQLLFRILNPLLAPLNGTCGQGEERRPLTLRRQLFHQLQNLRVAQLENRHWITSRDHRNTHAATGTGVAQVRPHDSPLGGFDRNSGSRSLCAECLMSFSRRLNFVSSFLALTIHQQTVFR